MARQKPADQVETLKKKQADLAAKLKEASAKAREHEKELYWRKCELLGALALDELQAHPKGGCASVLRERLQTTITKAADRALFDLPPLPKEKPAGAATDAPAASTVRKAPVDGESHRG